MHNHSDLLYMLVFILCRTLLVRCDEPPRTDNSSVVMFTSSSSPTYSIVDSGDNGGANGFRVAATAEDHHEDDQYLDILMSALNLTKLPDIAKVGRSKATF